MWILIPTTHKQESTIMASNQNMPQESNHYVNVSSLKNLIETDLDTAAVVAKLKDEDLAILAKEGDYLSVFGNMTSEGESDDHSDYLKIFPDLELACEIMISMILSPRNISRTELIYTAKCDSVPLSLLGSITEYVKKEVDDRYDLTNSLYDILKEVMYGSGAHISAVLPESTIDGLINRPENVSVETMVPLLNVDNLSAGKGILGPVNGSPATAMESILGQHMTSAEDDYLLFNSANSEEDLLNSTTLPGIEITDNFDVLKLPALTDAVKSKKAEDIIYPSMEDNSILEIPNLSNADRPNIGIATQIMIPKSSCVVIHRPNKPEAHVGYVVSLDEFGYPLNPDHNKAGRGKEIKSLIGKNTIGKTLLEKATAGLVKSTKKDKAGRESVKHFNEYMQISIRNRIKNGIVGGGIEVSSNSDIFSMVLARFLSNTNTRLLFIPSELVTYFALDFNKNGSGKNKLEDIELLSSIRSLLMFSGVANSIKNNIQRTNVKMNIDPKTPDADKVMKAGVREVQRASEFTLPIGLPNPLDQVKWIQKAGLSFSFDSHPGIPNTSFEFDYPTNEKPILDNNEALDEIRKQQLMKIGPTPEIVDNGFSSDFASTDESNRVLLSKRIRTAQSPYAKLVSEHQHRLILADGDLYGHIYESVEGYKDLKNFISSDADRFIYKNSKTNYFNMITKRIIRSIKVDFPTPDEDSAVKRFEEFNNYVDSLDAALPAWIDGEWLGSEIIGTLGDNIDQLVGTIRSYFIRKWCSEHNFLPELNSLVNKAPNGEPILSLASEMESHSKGMSDTVLEYVQELLKKKGELDKKLEGEVGGNEEEDTSDETTEEDEVTPTEEPTGDEDIPTEDTDAPPEGEEFDI